MSKYLNKVQQALWLESIEGFRQDGLLKTTRDGKRHYIVEEGKVKYIPKNVWETYEALDAAFRKEYADTPKEETMSNTNPLVAIFGPADPNPLTDFANKFFQTTQEEETMTITINNVTYDTEPLEDGGGSFIHADFDEDHHVKVEVTNGTISVWVNEILIHCHENDDNVLSNVMSHLAWYVNKYDEQMEENDPNTKLQTEERKMTTEMTRALVEHMSTEVDRITTQTAIAQIEEKNMKTKDDLAELLTQDDTNKEDNMTKIQCAGHYKNTQQCRKMGEPNFGKLFGCKNHAEEVENKAKERKAYGTFKCVKCSNEQGKDVYHGSADEVYECRYGEKRPERPGRPTRNSTFVAKEGQETRFFNTKAEAFAAVKELKDSEVWRVVHVGASKAPSTGWFVTAEKVIKEEKN